MNGGNAVFLQNRDFFGALVEHVPLFHALRVAEPRARLVAYSPFERARMFQVLGLADDVRVRPRSGRALWRELRAERYERIVSLRPKSLGLTAVIGASGATERIGYGTALSRAVFTRTVPRDVTIYRARNYLRLLAGVVPLPELDACVRWLAARSERRASPDARPWCLMPCGSEERKLWGLARFVELARRVADRERETRFVLVLGRNEAGYVEAFARAGLGSATDALIDGSLPDIARTVLDARVVISNDCGPSHVAQLAGVPQVSIFGNWDGAVAARLAEWFHPRPNAASVTTGAAADIGTIPVEAVLDAARDVLDRADSAGRAARLSAPSPAGSGA